MLLLLYLMLDLLLLLLLVLLLLMMVLVVERRRLRLKVGPNHVGGGGKCAYVESHLQTSGNATKFASFFSVYQARRASQLPTPEQNPGPSRSY